MKPRQLWCDQEGSALLEGIIVLPFLCALCFGVYEYSWYFYKQHLVATGVHDAARYLARALDPNNPTTPTTSLTPSFSTALPLARNLATRGTIDSSGALRVTGWVAGDVSASLTTIANPSNAYLGPNPLYVVNVTTTFTPSTLGLLGYFGLSAPSISVTHQERLIGPG